MCQPLRLRQISLASPQGRVEILQASGGVVEYPPKFSEFDVKPEIVEALEGVGIVRTFAIQELTLPIALAGDDPRDHDSNDDGVMDGEENAGTVASFDATGTSTMDDHFGDLLLRGFGCA